MLPEGLAGVLLRLASALGLVSLASGCSGSHDKTPPPAPADYSVQIGMPGGSDGLEFVPFDADQVLDLHTFGQGGTHVLLAARTTGFGIRAFATFTVTNLTTGNALVSPAPTRPQLFYCHDDVCDLVPVTMMMGGIAGPGDDRDGLPIDVAVEVHDDAGHSVTDSADATLSTRELGDLDAGL
jgi:hypothetical protein